LNLRRFVTHFERAGEMRKTENGKLSRLGNFAHSLEQKFYSKNNKGIFFTTEIENLLLSHVAFAQINFNIGINDSESKPQSKAHESS
jgi:hypothetical protein